MLKKQDRVPILRAVAVSRRGAVAVCEAVALIGALGLAAHVNRPEHWQPLSLLWLLIAFAILSELLTVEGGRLRISGSFIAIVLAMVILGPAPAAVVAVTGIAFDAVRSRPLARHLLHNVTAYAVFPIAGGAAFQILERFLPDDGVMVRAVVVVAVFVATNVVNFVLIAMAGAVAERHRFRDDVREILLPLLPSQVAAGVLAAAVDALYTMNGTVSIAMAAVTALLFQHLLRTTMLSVARAKELEERTHELASTQVGLVTTVLRTLSLRDKMTARHSAAVARYAREVARDLGLDDEAQEKIHTAALLHDIGKFIFPDSILLSSRGLTDEEYEVVKRHPEQGARLVRRIDGYGEIADIILAHHERIDGRGYPNGIIGEDIPIGARIIAVCDTYDVMTARDSYREPVTPHLALRELARVAGSQLDASIVAVFTDMIERRGIAFRHSDDADFEAELDLERLVAEHARPRRVAA